MRIAIPVWGNKVSPVFDTSEHLLLVDIEDGVEKNREIIKLEDPVPIHRSNFLQRLGVHLLVCGAITRELETSFDEDKIKIIPFICGNVEQIITALTKGNRIREMFGMPGRHEN